MAGPERPINMAGEGGVSTEALRLVIANSSGVVVGERPIIPPELPGSPEDSRFREAIINAYRALRISSFTELRQQLAPPVTTAESGPVIRSDQQIIEVVGVESPEPLQLPERREILPPLDDLVKEIRRLEALPVLENANDLGHRYHSENLKALELRYNQFKEYLEKMRTPEAARLEFRLAYYQTLQAGLAAGSVTTAQLLEFTDSLTEDPIIAGINRKITALEATPALTRDQRVNLETLRRERNNLVNDKNGQIPDGLIPALQERIRTLTERSVTQPLDPTETAELEAAREALQDYQVDSHPNRLLRRVVRLRDDPARVDELRQTLTEILRQETNQVRFDLGFMERMAEESLINKDLEREGEEIDEDRDQQELDDIREAKAEAIERFADLPALNEVYSAYEQAVRTGDNLGAELAEARIGRYFYHARRIGITRAVYREFTELLDNLRRPEVGYYGKIVPFSPRNISERLAVFESQENSGFYRRNGWDREFPFAKFAGVRPLLARYAENRLLHAIERMNDPNIPPLPDYLSGEWNLDREERKMTEQVQSTLLWEKNYAGYYTLRIDPKSPLAKQQLETVADQWILFMESGVIPKNPQEQLGEWRKFIEQWQSLALLIYNNDMGQVTRLRQQLKFRVEAPIAAYFNSVDNDDNFAAMLQNISGEVEATDVWRQGYGSLNGMVAQILHFAENDPTFYKLLFHPEGSRGYLSPEGSPGSPGSNAAQRFLRDIVIKQLIEHTAQFSLSDRSAVKDQESNRLNTEIDRLIALTEPSDADIRNLASLRRRRVNLSQEIRKVNRERIGLDQPKAAFERLYGRLEDQDDFKRLPEKEKDRIKKEKSQEAAAAWGLAKNILNITGAQSSRGGPTIKIRNPQQWQLECGIENLNSQMTDIDGFIAGHEFVDVQLQGGGIERQSVFHIAQKTGEHKQIIDRIAVKKQERAQLAEQLKTKRAEHRRVVRQLQSSPDPFNRSEDRLPLRMVVRYAQYAVYRAEKTWAEQADLIMRDNNLSSAKKEQAVQNLTEGLIPVRTARQSWNLTPGKNNLSSLLEAVYRDALDEVFEKGFRTTLDIATGVTRTETAITVDRDVLKDAQGKTLFIEDIDRIPESNGMLNNYVATEEVTGNVISLPYRVAEAKAGRGGFLGRALRVLDPAFNRFSKEGDPNYLREFQDLQRALNAAVEAQWQRHFQIRIEALERCIVGADIRKNKTGKKEDRYKIIDGNFAEGSLLEFGREELYTTGRIINHAAEVIKHSDRRSRRATDLGLYSPMQHESLYDEAGVEDSRELFGLIDTESAIVKSREKERTDFLFLLLKGERWKLGARQRIALESGTLDGKQLTGLLEKVYTSGDRLNRVRDGWIRSYRTLGEVTVATSPTGGRQKAIVDSTADVELEEFITMAESADEREKLSTDTLYPDLSTDRLSQAPLWKDGVDPFLPDGTLNFNRFERGNSDTLLKSDNGTSRHTSGIWFERIKQWRLDPKKGGRWYPGIFKIAQDLASQRWIFGQYQTGFDVLKGRNTR